MGRISVTTTTRVLALFLIEQYLMLIISTILMTVGIAIVTWTCVPSSFTIYNFGTQKVVKNCVGSAALKMVEEVRRQFNIIPGLMEGHAKPDYATCVKISTDASIKEMIPPGALVMLTPLIVGVFFGVETFSGVLAGSLVSGVQIAISASNTGGAWDNAKKYIEILKNLFSFNSNFIPLGLVHRSCENPWTKRIRTTQGCRYWRYNWRPFKRHFSGEGWNSYVDIELRPSQFALSLTKFAGTIKNQYYNQSQYDEVRSE